MKKSLILNFEVLENFNISVEEFLFLYSISINTRDINTNFIDLEKLQKQQLIKIIKDNNKIYILREKSIKLIEFLTVEIESSLVDNKVSIKKSDRAIKEDIGQRIGEFRIKWKGLKSGAMGSSNACNTKLTRWMKENPEYTFDDILRAADIYIESLDGNYRFLQRADYFIFKQENNKEESSRLSAFVDEIGNDTTQDWTTTLK